MVLVAFRPPRPLSSDPLSSRSRSGDEKVQKHDASAPVQRAGQPAEVAPLYVFLASDKSSYFSGEIVGVTGGSPLA